MRTLAKYRALDQIIRKNWEEGQKEVHSQATFVQRIKRKADRDNAQASLKSTFDGFADARVIEDDCGFIHHPVQFTVGPERKVVIEMWTE